MLNKEYPLHDMNLVFEMIEKSIAKGGTDPKASDEMNLLMHLYAGLPAEAVECGMMFIHGRGAEVPATSDINPLHVRLMNLLEYLEKVEYLADIPATLSNDEIKKRSDIVNSLNEHEKLFGTPLLGYQFNSGSAAPSEVKEGEEEENGGRLLLMNSQAAVFACEDIYKTSVFYEDKLGFKAAHLDDEAMPHIKLTRDNIVIVLVKGEGAITKPMREFGIDYDMYIYCSEPFLLHNEVAGNGIKIVEDLPEAKAAQKQDKNRQFVFEDIDGRHICVSQYLEG
ncbi:hypothetical protein SAMN02910264_01099 [Ruminococcaceae bacterium YAD3003]|nr:hypothetical protein SAMN02910264_01099 [Ruminococcaceae bacterium YAD3003]